MTVTTGGGDRGVLEFAERSVCVEVRLVRGPTWIQVGIDTSDLPSCLSQRESGVGSQALKDLQAVVGEAYEPVIRVGFPEYLGGQLHEIEGRPVRLSRRRTTTGCVVASLVHLAFRQYNCDFGWR